MSSLGLGFVVLYILLEYFYFAVARKFQIVDKPNLRSSHQILTIRGGGIIFPIATLVPLLFELYPNWLIFAISLLLISVLSFIDDIKSLSSPFRLLIQSIAIVGLLFSLDVSLGWYLWILCFITIMGIINAYNFMDGINGITAIYSFVTIGSLLWTSHFISELLPDIFFISFIAATLVFSFFNVRKKAICFAGDVGSVSIAFIICLLLLKLMLNTGSIWWLGFLGIYGIDTLFTILCRIVRRESLMEAHRSHFYQWLANEAKWPHVKVSTLYAGLQLVVNGIAVYGYFAGQPWLVVVVLFVILLIYTIFRLRLEGRKRLLVKY